MTKYHILIAEDDEDIAELMRLYLTMENYEVHLSYDGQAAWEYFQANPVELAIIDVMMPKMNGYELMRNIRSMSNVPAVIVSAKDRNIDKIMGLNSGADMYLTKPFDPLELVANVKAVMRRYYQLGGPSGKTNEASVFKAQDLTLDINSMTIKKGETVIFLTTTEYRVLSKLIQDAGKVITKEQLIESVRADYIDSDINALAVHISNIRGKLGDDPAKPRYIKTIRGLGYKLEK